jgi:hypothetical protein
MLISDRIARVLVLVVSVSVVTAAAAQHQHEATEKLGTVKFATSCSAAAQPAFARGMALLHSFEYGPAIDSFTAAATADSGCGIAYWGIALSRWGNPFAAGIKPPAALKAGRDAVEKGRAAGAKTERERAFIDAVARLFTDFETLNQRTRALAYRDAMKQVAARYPDDAEAAAFYALSLASSQDPTDMTYASLLEAGAILEKLAPSQPDHPGFVHYIIHAYDAPPLAPRAIEAARRYAKIAPSAPHALHMPSHTFTRLGYWQDSIDTNIASAEAARRVKVPAEELHAMDYQMYAYLQQAQDGSAKRLLDELAAALERFKGPSTASAAPPLAGAYAVAAIPARYALERGAWADAARLDVTPSPFPFAEAVTWFAKGMGAARSNDAAGARAAATALDSLRAKLEQAGEVYWTEQVKIQHLGVTAWLAWAEGRRDEALTVLREAADREDRTEKNAVTPGPIAPAREQLGDMLLVMKQPAAALAAFETTLKKEPNRYRALSGAARAASEAGNAGAAKKYTTALATLTKRTDGPPRTDLRDTKK